MYAFVMHVSVYMLLCMHCQGYHYACMVIVKLCMQLAHRDDIGML